MGYWNLGLIIGANASQLRAEMRSAGNSVSTLMGANHKLAKSARKYQRQQARHVRGVVKGVSMIAATGIILSKFASKARSADAEVRGLAAIMKVSAASAEGMYRQFRDANKEFSNFAPSEVTGRMKALAQAGYSQNEVIKNTAAVLRAVNSSLGALNSEQATELGINLERGFGQAGTSMSDLIDVAVMGANKFPMTLDKIATAMGYATDVANTYDQSLQSVVTSIGVLIPVTKTASKAGTAYRNMLMSLTRPKTIAFLKQMHIAVRDINGEFRDATDIISEVSGALEPLRAKDRKNGTMKVQSMIRAMFGIRGQAGFAAFSRLRQNVTGTGPLSGQKFSSTKMALMALQDSFGATEGASRSLASSMEKGSQFIDQRFNASLESLEVALGQIASPIVDHLKTAASDVLRSVAKTVEPNRDASSGLPGPLAESLTKLAMYGLTAVTVLGGVKLLTSIGPMFKSFGAMRNLVLDAEYAAGRGLEPTTASFRKLKGGSARWADVLHKFGVGSKVSVPDDRITSPEGEHKWVPRFLGLERRLSLRERYSARKDARMMQRLGAKPTALYRGGVDTTTKWGKVAGVGKALLNVGFFATGLVAVFRHVSQVLTDTVNDMAVKWRKKLGELEGKNDKVAQIVPYLRKYLSGKELTGKDLRQIASSGNKTAFGTVLSGVLGPKYGGTGGGVKVGMRRLYDLMDKSQLHQMGFGGKFKGMKDLAEGGTEAQKAVAERAMARRAKGMSEGAALEAEFYNQPGVLPKGMTPEQYKQNVYLGYSARTNKTDIFHPLTRPGETIGSEGGVRNVARKVAVERRLASGKGASGSGVHLLDRFLLDWKAGAIAYARTEGFWAGVGQGIGTVFERGNVGSDGQMYFKAEGKGLYSQTAEPTTALGGGTGPFALAGDPADMAYAVSLIAGATKAGVIEGMRDAGIHPQGVVTSPANAATDQ